MPPFTLPRLQEHVDAQLGLAKAYYRGDGVPQSYKEAALWLAKASGLGSEEATFQLDSLLQIKPGVAPLLGSVRVHGTSNKEVNGLEGGLPPSRFISHLRSKHNVCYLYART